MRLPSGLKATLRTRPLCPARRLIPDFYRAVAAAAGEEFSFGIAGQADDLARVFLEAPRQLAGGHVPDADGAIPVPGGQPFTVVAQGDAGDAVRLSAKRL